MNPYKTVQEEKDAIVSFVSANPYPSYTEMMNRLESFPELYAEYGEYNHMAMKTCYENLTNKEVCKRVGEHIYNRGGIQAMRSNYYVLKILSPLAMSTDIVVKCAARDYVECAWDGIGSWRY